MEGKEKVQTGEEGVESGEKRKNETLWSTQKQSSVATDWTVSKILHDFSKDLRLDFFFHNM